MIRQVDNTLNREKMQLRSGSNTNWKNYKGLT
jgi:hypothetical protein